MAKGLLGQELIEMDAGVENMGHCDLDWGDYDNDGEMDLMVAVHTSNGVLYTRLFSNALGSNTYINNFPPV
ncbi:MAG: hypothetical protein WC151_09980 [Bacteroidales bacterium]|jgi:hypothetical protein